MKKLIAPIAMAIVGFLATALVINNVLTSASVTLANIRIDGKDYQPNASLTLPTGTQSVQVEVTPTDPEAVVEVSGDSGFVEGDNILSVKVTGSDGKKTETYKVTMNQPKLAGWCEQNADKILLYNSDYETADVYGMIDLAYLDDGRLPEIQANLACFSDILQAYVNKNY